MTLFNYECDEIKRIIEEVSPNYPQLTTYEKEWLYFYKYGYMPGTPVELEYETVNISPSATVLNAIPYQYKSAILKGNTDENLLSVQMPVLTTTGKNLFNVDLEQGSINTNTGNLIETMQAIRSKDFIKLPPNDTFTISKSNGTQKITIIIYDKNYKRVRTVWKPTFTLTGDEMYVKIADTENDLNNQYQIEKGNTPSSYEPYKANILTVDEDVILRSNGDVYDELDLLTGKLTQRIGDNGDVLSQEIVKTVHMNKLNKPYEGVNHYYLSANIPCEAVLEVPIVSTGEQTLEEINHY